MSVLVWDDDAGEVVPFIPTQAPAAVTIPNENCHYGQEFAGTQRDTLSSFINTSRELVKVTAERDAALAALGRVEALLGDHDGALWAVRGVRQAVSAPHSSRSMPTLQQNRTPSWNVRVTLQVGSRNTPATARDTSRIARRSSAAVECKRLTTGARCEGHLQARVAPRGLRVPCADPHHRRGRSQTETAR